MRWKLAADQEIADDDMGYWLEQLGLEPQPRRHVWESDEARAGAADFPVVVIGAGLNGVNAAIQLKLAGSTSRFSTRTTTSVGRGTQNRYPGARVDLVSRVYSHAFAVDFPFKHYFAPQAENERYVTWCVDTFEVRDHIRFGVEVTQLRWDEPTGLWEIDLRRVRVNSRNVGPRGHLRGGCT